uniref:Uncharacterized protein n=1 Tax=Cucumis melo TaxID=3656 RepID=A0A9I9EAY1_CUCME
MKLITHNRYLASNLPPRLLAFSSCRAIEGIICSVSRTFSSHFHQKKSRVLIKNFFFFCLSVLFIEAFHIQRSLLRFTEKVTIVSFPTARHQVIFIRHLCNAPRLRSSSVGMEKIYSSSSPKNSPSFANLSPPLHLPPMIHLSTMLY